MNWFHLVFLVALLQTPPAQRPPGTATVEGVVVRLGTNEPIPRVDLELTSDDPVETRRIYPAATGPDGRFAIRNVAAGTYKLVAARIGGTYVPAEYGQRGVLGRGVLFPIADGEQKKDMRMEMAPVGTI